MELHAAIYLCAVVNVLECLVLGWALFSGAKKSGIQVLYPDRLYLLRARTPTYEETK